MESTTSADEERILRVWTPILLRTILIVAAILLAIGLLSAAWLTPGYITTRFHTLQTHGVSERVASMSKLMAQALKGDPHSIMTLGLIALTLVPLARVAFCFLLFVRERDGKFVVFTAYVLVGLIVGVMLGRVG